jgi:hypothetical protein
LTSRMLTSSPVNGSTPASMSSKLFHSTAGPRELSHLTHSILYHQFTSLETHFQLQPPTNPQPKPNNAPPHPPPLPPYHPRNSNRTRTSHRLQQPCLLTISLNSRPQRHARQRLSQARAKRVQQIGLGRRRSRRRESGFRPERDEAGARICDC